jgi:hypothetical protein
MLVFVELDNPDILVNMAILDTATNAFMTYGDNNAWVTFTDLLHDLGNDLSISVEDMYAVTDLVPADLKVIS